MTSAMSTRRSNQLSQPPIYSKHYITKHYITKKEIGKYQKTAPFDSMVRRRC